MKKVVFLSCFVSALFIMSCKKDSDDNGGPSEKMKLITSAAWKYDIAKIDITGDEVGDQDLPPGLLEDCDKDNTLTFNTDSTGVVNNGATKCDAADPQSVDFTWEFKDNETVISIPENVFGDLSGDAKIKTLTASKLTLVKEVQITTPITATVNVVIDLKH